MLMVLLVFLVALDLAWVLGVLARTRGPLVFWGLAALGVVLLYVLPLVYEAHLFDGNCYALDGTATPCTLEERMWHSFKAGFVFMIPPVLMWLAVYVFSSRQAPR